MSSRAVPDTLPEPKATYSVRDLAERYGVGQHTVLNWIRSGELKALNVGTAPGKRKPRWRVTARAVAEFEAARTPTPAVPRVRRKRQPAEVIEFYR